MADARTFTARLADLLARERTALAELLVALAEFDAKRLWLSLGYASLFDYLHRELGLSKGAAFYRKSAVELIGRFPEVIEPIRDGRLCLMSLAEVARVLTPENRDALLPRFFRLSKREAQALAVTLLPLESHPRRAVVTTVRQVAPALALAMPAPAAPERDPVQPVEPVTVSRRFLEKLEKARAALSHSHPGAGADEILEAGLDLLIERHEKRRGIVEKPRREPPPSRPDHVPAHVRRAVWARDGGRYQWPLEGGGICGSTWQVELDHVTPRARGGLATVEGMRCLCRLHNDLAAREAYGDAWMDRFTSTRERPEHAAAP